MYIGKIATNGLKHERLRNSGQNGHSLKGEQLKKEGWGRGAIDAGVHLLYIFNPKKSVLSKIFQVFCGSTRGCIFFLSVRKLRYAIGV